jgi:large subunit ribosomal protein L13
MYVKRGKNIFTTKGIIVDLQPFNGYIKILIVDTLSYKTISANAKTVDKKWVLVDADRVPLGRIASIVAIHIRGKHKTNFTPHVDCGDNVIVINAEKVSLSGNKWKQKQYIRHTGYPGGQRSLNAEQLSAKGPERLIENAVRGMLPKNKLGAALFRNLKVFVGDEHSHEAQKPKTINIKEHI